MGFLNNPFFRGFISWFSLLMSLSFLLFIYSAELTSGSFTILEKILGLAVPLGAWILFMFSRDRHYRDIGFGLLFVGIVINFIGTVILLSCQGQFFEKLSIYTTFASALFLFSVHVNLTWKNTHLSKLQWATFLMPLTVFMLVSLVFLGVYNAPCLGFLSGV